MRPIWKHDGIFSEGDFENIGHDLEVENYSDGTVVLRATTAIETGEIWDTLIYGGTDFWWESDDTFELTIARGDNNTSETFTITFDLLPVTEFAGGDGTEDNPFQIETPQHLNNVRYHLDANFVLIGDIDLDAYLSEGGDGYNDGAGWEPIGNSDNPFTGTFNGNGHIISHLNMYDTTVDRAGLFGWVEEATIKNLTLDSPDVEGGCCGGSLVGYAEESHISYIKVNGGTVSGKENVGGLVGYAEGYGMIGTTVKNCYATGDVEGNNNVGGLVGLSSDETIENSYATGNVTGGSNAGGLVGLAEGYSQVRYSFALNQLIEQIPDTTGNFGRIAGNIGGYSNLEFNFANAEMAGPEGAFDEKFHTGKDGADLHEQWGTDSDGRLSQPVLATISEIQVGDEEPEIDVVLVGDTFHETNATILDNWDIDTGDTGLTVSGITIDSSNHIATISFSKTADERTITIQAKAAALTSTTASKEIEVNVQPVVPETYDVTINYEDAEVESFELNDEAVADGGSETFDEGETVNFSVTLENGREFDEWTGDTNALEDDGVLEPTIENIDGDVTLTLVTQEAVDQSQAKVKPADTTITAGDALNLDVTEAKAGDGSNIDRDSVAVSVYSDKDGYLDLEEDNVDFSDPEGEATIQISADQLTSVDTHELTVKIADVSDENITVTDDVEVEAGEPYADNITVEDPSVIQARDESITISITLEEVKLNIGEKIIIEDFDSINLWKTAEDIELIDFSVSTSQADASITETLSNGELELEVADADIEAGETVTVEINQPEDSDFWIGDSDESNSFSVQRSDTEVSDTFTFNINTPDYNLRDIGPAGGHIFYIDIDDDFDWKYLEAALESTEWEEKQWGSQGIDIQGTSPDIGTGADNTQAIIEQGENHSGRAAHLASNLDHGGYNDWFLPSRKDLVQMHENLHVHEKGDFKGAAYWSSTQSNSGDAGILNFEDGGTGSYYKSNEHRVRAVRSF